jgi:hypothetical protein
MRLNRRYRFPWWFLPFTVQPIAVDFAPPSVYETPYGAGYAPMNVPPPSFSTVGYGGGVEAVTDPRIPKTRSI